MKIVGRIAFIVVIVAAVFGYQAYQKSNFSQEVLNEVSQQLKDLPGYAENQELYEEGLNEFHDEAFSAAYRSGSRRRAAEFDERAYWVNLTANLKRKASQSGLKEIEAELGAMLGRLDPF